MIKLFLLADKFDDTAKSDNLLLFCDLLSNHSKHENKTVVVEEYLFDFTHCLVSLQSNQT